MIGANMAWVSRDLIIERLVCTRNGGFGDCAASADLFEAQDGRRIWQMTVISADNFRPESRRINLHCIVIDDSVRCAKAEVRLPSFDPVICSEYFEPDDEVKQGILSTIQGWEKQLSKAANDGRSAAE